MHARPMVVGLDERSVSEIRTSWERGEAIGLISEKAAVGEQEEMRARLADTEVPEGTAFVVFTSGSTGVPKGVVLSRAAIEAAVGMAERVLGVREDDRWLLALSPAHMGGLGVVMRGLLRGVPVEIAGADLARALEGVTLVSLVPTQLSSLLRDAGWVAPSGLRAILLGGAAAPTALIDEARARGVPVLTTYGMTETCGQAATAPIGEVPPRGAIGKALPGVSIAAGTRADAGTIVIETPARFSGYLGGPAVARVETADLGFVEDGWLYVVGRRDDIIITGGHKVHPATVEAALSIAGVAEIAVVGLADPHWGQTLAAVVVPAPAFSRAALDAAIAALPPHQRPRHVQLLDALPLLPSGKLDRTSVADLVRRSADRQVRPGSR